jgi:hypothetical protein
MIADEIALAAARARDVRARDPYNVGEALAQWLEQAARWHQIAGSAEWTQMPHLYRLVAALNQPLPAPPALRFVIWSPDERQFLHGFTGRLDPSLTMSEALAKGGARTEWGDHWTLHIEDAARCDVATAQRIRSGDEVVMLAPEALDRYRVATIS